MCDRRGARRERLQAGEVDEPAQTFDLRLKRPGHLFELGLVRDLRERAPFAGQLRECALGGRVDEQRLHVAGVLVSRRSQDGPVAQLLANCKIFSTQICSTPFSRSRCR